MDTEEKDSQDWECLISDHFGRTPLLPQPAAPRGRDNTPPIYLHCQTTKKSVHFEYTQSITQPARSVKYTTFVKIWNNCLPHIKIASPKDDVCATCEKLRKKVIDAKDEEEKLESSS